MTHLPIPFNPAAIEVQVALGVLAGLMALGIGQLLEFESRKHPLRLDLAATTLMSTCVLLYSGVLAAASAWALFGWYYWIARDLQKNEG